jgi:hypothetical protein
MRPSENDGKPWTIRLHSLFNNVWDTGRDPGTIRPAPLSQNLVIREPGPARDVSGIAQGKRPGKAARR